MATATTIIRRGDLAYYESFAGMVPVKVLDQATHRTATGSVDGVIVRVTADRGTYRRGEVMTAAEFAIVPRSHVRTRNGVQYVVNHNYEIRWND